jgi:hypothetical protein
MAIYYSSQKLNKSLSEIFDVPYDPNIDLAEDIESIKNNSYATNVGENNPNYGLKHTDEWKKEASERVSGQKNPMYGKKKDPILHEKHREFLLTKNPMWDENIKRKSVLARTGRKAKPETLQKMSDSLSKEWTLLSPQNEIVKIKNLKKFCENLGLDVSNMHKVTTGKYKQHKGWKKTTDT